MEVKDSISKNDLMGMTIGDELKIAIGLVNSVRSRISECNGIGRYLMPEMKWESQSFRADGYVSIIRTK